MRVLALGLLGCPAALAFLAPLRPPSAHAPTLSGPQYTARRSTSLQMSSLASAVVQMEKLLQDYWATTVPNSLSEITTEAAASLSTALQAGERRLRIDIRTPGLADQFEQTAARDKALLLGTIATFFDAVPPEKKTKFLYQSEGEAAMATKAYTQGGFEIPENITFTGISSNAVTPDDEVLFFVEPANKPADPVILTVEELVQKHPDMQVVLFNPDLEYKGATGIRERDRRQGFLDSFKPAYIFRSLVSLSRPSLIPRELGALTFRYEESMYRIFRCLLPANEDGPGSLNRYMKRLVYEMTPDTPTAKNPPKFYQVGEFSQRPEPEQLSEAMGRSEEILSALVREASESVQSVDVARDVLLQACVTRGVDPAKVESAMTFLEKENRKGGKKGPEEQAKEQEELSKAIIGDWRLVFTTGTKGTQKRIGNINYFPLKAYQSFAKDGPGDYKNTIYLGSWPAVQVRGKYSCPGRRRLDFTVEEIGLGPINFKNSGEGFFTFFFVDDRIAVARGQGGGLAVWCKGI